MGLGANLSGVSSTTGLAKDGAKAMSPYEEDTIPEFTDSPQVSVFYGSTIALQMSDGRFLRAIDRRRTTKGESVLPLGLPSAYE